MNTKQMTALLITILLLLSLYGCAIITEPSESTSSAETRVEQPKKSACPTIDETVIYDREELTIKVTGMEYNSAFKTYVVKTSIQNHSDETISYSLNWANVNGYTISALVFGDIYGGKAAFADFGLPQDELQLAGIKSIQEISFTFKCKYGDRDELICEVPATLRTSAYGETVTEYSFDGTEAYLSDEYRILIAPYSNPTVDHPLVICVENRADHPVLLSYEGVALNEQMVTQLMSGPYVLPNSRRIEVMTIAYFGNEPKIDTIESATLSFQLTPYHSDGSFSTADTIMIPVISVPIK